eukprot:6803998-Prymnesium_polylepis.1
MAGASKWDTVRGCKSAHAIVRNSSARARPECPVEATAPRSWPRPLRRQLFGTLKRQLHEAITKWRGQEADEGKISQPNGQNIVLRCDARQDAQVGEGNKKGRTQASGKKDDDPTRCHVPHRATGFHVRNRLGPLDRVLAGIHCPRHASRSGVCGHAGADGPNVLDKSYRGRDILRRYRAAILYY